MTVYDIVSLNRELLKRLHKNGIKVNDYKWLDLYNDYLQMKADGDKTSYIVAKRRCGMDDGVLDAQVGRVGSTAMPIDWKGKYFFQASYGKSSFDDLSL